MCRFFCKHESPFLWDECPEVQFLGCVVVVWLVLLPKWFPEWLCHFSFLSVVYDDPVSLHHHQHSVFFLCFSHSNRYVVTAHCSFDISLMINSVGHNLFVSCMSLFGGIALQVFCLFLIWLWFLFVFTVHWICS